MKNTLILFTYSFPYNPPSEEFLLEEILILAKKFDDIIIVPTSHSSYTKDVRELGLGNITVKRVERKNKVIEILENIIPIIFSSIAFNEVYKLLKQGLLFNKTAIKVLFIYLINARIIFKNTRKIFSELEDCNLFLYSYWFYDLAQACIRIKKAVRKNKRFKTVIAISRAHGCDVFSEINIKNYLPCREMLSTNLNMIYSVSEAGRDFLVLKGVEKEKILASRLGVRDLEWNDNKEICSPYKIVTCSYMCDVKRIHLIVEALSYIDDLDIEWTHFGDGPLFENIKQNCKKSLPINIKYNFKGKTKNSKILIYYKQNSPHLFLNTSSIEGIPVSIMEAISFGIPVIATDVGGTNEICKTGYNGILLKKDFDIIELTESIRKLLSLGQSDYNVICRNSRQLFLSDFNNITNYNKFTDSILNLK